MVSYVTKFSVVLVFASLSSCQDETCLDCICQAVSGCNETLKCVGEPGPYSLVCGPYAITQPYWIDAGKPILDGGSPDDADAYQNCANNKNCAEKAVQAYVRKYSQDCNADGQVDCSDYMAIHMKGGFGCSGNLPSFYLEGFNNCMAESSIDIRMSNY